MNAKRIISTVLIFIIISSVFTVSAGVTMVVVSKGLENVGIDYDVSNVIVAGTIAGKAIQGYFIDLTNETITVPSDYKIKAYSINNGEKWTSLNSKVFDDAELAKLFSKDLILSVTDKYDSKTKKPTSDAKIVNFAKINKRPALKNYSENYLIGADETGKTTGTWVLTEKNGTQSVKENIEIAVADSSGKNPDSKGYGKFYGKNGTTNGIEVAELSADGKVVSKMYFIRNAATVNNDGTYTAASKPSKITVKGQRKPSTYNVNKTKKYISYAANTYIFINNTELKESKGKLDVSDGGDIYLWSAATATNPASAIKKMSITSGDKTISFSDVTITKLPETVIFGGENSILGLNTEYSNSGNSQQDTSPSDYSLINTIDLNTLSSQDTQSNLTPTEISSSDTEEPEEPEESDFVTIMADEVLYGEIGIKFWEILEAEGTSPIEWEWTDSTGGKSNLPPGLVLSDLELPSDPARDQYGIISGTPTQAGFYNIIVSAISRRGSSSEVVGTKNITIVIRSSVNVASITGVPTEAPMNKQITIKATVNPSDATYQSIIWDMATMEDVIKDVKGVTSTNIDVWIMEIRTLLSEVGITKPFELLDLIDNADFIRELARRVGITIPQNTDLNNPVQMFDAVSDIIKKSPPYGDISLTQNNIRKTTAGTVWIKATIKNGNSENPGTGNPDFVKYFSVNFKEFVPALNITGVPMEATAEVPLTLKGDIIPYTATNTTVTWEIKETDIPGGVTLKNGVLTAANAGNVIITARIRNGASISPVTDYTKDFLIKVVPQSPVLTVIEPQSIIPESGTASKVTYNIETKYISDGVYSINLNSSNSGITLGSVAGIEIKKGKGTLTVHSAATVLEDVYSLLIELQNVDATDGRIVGTVKSNKFAFKVVSPPEPIPPTIICPSELTDGTFPPKEVGGSMKQLNLPNGSMNIQYNATLLTKGFEYESPEGNEIIPPTYWRVIGGTLPPGLTLTQWIEGASTATSANNNPNSSSGVPPTGTTGWDTGYARAGCVIEGKPTETGVGKLYTIIVEADEIVYFNRNTAVVWQKEGYAQWIADNPQAEKIIWTSGNSNVNTVVFSGKKAVRVINIYIESGIYYPATGLKIVPDTLRVPLGGTGSLAADVMSANTGAPHNFASNQNVTWRTNNPGVATIDEYGNVFGVSEGTAIITATTYDKNITATREVTVFNTPVTGVNLNKSAMTLTVGGTDLLIPTVRPTDATNKAVSFNSSDLNVATIDEYGKITAVGEGNTTITVTTLGFNASGAPASAICTVVVQNAPSVRATKVSINKTATRLMVGESERLEATVSPEDASKRTVTWRSSNSTLVAVDPITGQITAIAVTTAPVIITAKVDQSGTAVEVECRVEVIEPPAIENISLNKSTAIVPIGMSETLTATLTPIHSLEYNRDNLIWRSLDENIATVDSKGTVTGKTVGTTTIEVGTINGLIAECTIQVMPLSSTVPTFVDVNSSEWYFSYINQAVSYGLVNGIGNNMFGPELNITRAEFVTMIIRALNLTLKKDVNIPFKDVSSGEWYYNYIKIAVAEGLITKLISDEDDNFYPDRAIRREEMAVILSAAAKKQGLTVNLLPSNTLADPTDPNIKDSKLITPQYAEDIDFVYKLGLMNGYTDGKFDPHGVSTRAQAATVIVRLYHEVTRLSKQTF